MAKSTYIGKRTLPSVEEMSRELLAWYAFAQRDKEQFEANARWYWTAQDDCRVLAQRYGMPLHTVIQVVAAISPGKKWTINVRDAEYILQSISAVGSSEEERFAYLKTLSYQTGYTWENTRNAYAILDGGGDIPRERIKTYSFARNIEFPGEGKEVTIDLHMGHVLGKTRKRGPVNVSAVYHDMADAVRLVAMILGIDPEVLQSIIWGGRVDAFEAGYCVDSLCDLIASMEDVEAA